MTTAGNIRDRIKADLVINGTDYDDQILAAIQSALRLYRKKRYWFLQAFTTLTTVVGNNKLDLPNDFGAPDEFELLYGGGRLSDGQGFDFLEFPRLRRDHWTTSPLSTTVPCACAVFGGSLYLSCLANGAYSIDTTYYRQDAVLPNVNDTSVWFDDGQDAIRTRAQLIFKRDAQNVMPSEEDGSQAIAALQALDDAHIRYRGGR